MNKIKTAIIITLCIVSISVFLFFVPLDNIFVNLPILKDFYQNTTLEISSPNGKASIKIDGKEYGETPASIKNLSAGTYTVELTRASSQEGFYKTHTFDVPLTKNTVSVINVEIGPDDSLHGIVIHYMQDSSKDLGKGKITITSDTQDTKVYVNDEFLKNAPVTNVKLNTGEYNIKLETDSYEDLVFPIIVSEGYILYIKGYQMPVPVTFESVSNNE